LEICSIKVLGRVYPILELLCVRLKEKHKMPYIKSKSIENYKAALMLSKDSCGMYSASIHCAYYSCFLLVKHILCHKCYISYASQNNQNAGSHLYIIKLILDDLLAKGEDDAYDIFDTNISELKRLRRIADYENSLISPDESREALVIADETLDILKDVYKGL
jgi:hypothetical protein